MDKSIEKKFSPEEFFVIQKDDYISIEVVGLLIEQMQAITILLIETESEFCTEVLISMMNNLLNQGQKICSHIEIQESN